MRLAAAMSGGVDSAVAAARAIAAGHDVVGVHLALTKERPQDRCGSRGCCSVSDANDARRAAAKLGIDFYIWDVSDRFADDVMADFFAEYAAGRTPNPCLRCNEKIKFAAVLDKVIALGFDGLITGHYAQLCPGPDGVELHRGIDEAKDQSYVLASLTTAQLEKCHFPLGDTVKEGVRAEAASLGLTVANKPDSYDICFIPDGDTAGFLRRELGEQPGQIVTSDGQVVGEHAGAYAYTVGQRRGLRLGQPTDDGKPRYVLRIDPVQNQVVVGSAQQLQIKKLRAIRPNYIGQRPNGSVTVQLRAHGRPLPAAISATDEGIEVMLAEPTTGVAPGQQLVAYLGTQVVASGVIEETT